MTETDKAAAVVQDSRMTLEEALAGTKAPASILRSLCLVEVRHYGFDGRLHQGQLVVHQSVRQDILDLFALIEESRFPVEKAVPIVAYGWSDDASMADNNASAFNYRTIAGTKRISRHAKGMAVDINPRLNPVIYKDGRISPPRAAYRPGEPGVLTKDHPVVRFMEARGWVWGGDFKSFKDYHHFQKPD